MEEFYKNLKAKKSLLVMGIILFVLFMGIGLLLYFDEANAEFVKLSNKTGEGVYAKVNVSLLDSAFATETVDNKKRDYYLAFDEDNNPYVVMLDSDAKEALRKVQEYTLSEKEMDKPDAVTIYGYTVKSDTEIYKYLQEFLTDEDGNTYSIDTLKSTVGEIYLDTSWKKSEQAISSLILFGLFSLSGIALMITYFVRNKKYKKMILEYGRELEKVESDIRNGSGIYSKECHVYLTDNYILSYGSGVKLIELKDIVWIYPFITRQRGIVTNKCLYVITNDKKTNVIALVNAMSKKNKSAFDELYQNIINRVSDVLIGYSKENKELVKEKNTEVYVGVRPEHIQIEPNENGKYTVNIVETLGSELLIHFNIDENTMVCAKVITDEVIKVGQKINVSFKTNSIHLFDKENEVSYF